MFQNEYPSKTRVTSEPIFLSYMGSVVISLDAELAWGYHDQQKFPHERIVDGRKAWDQLVDLFEKYRIPATWAIVGHLFLEECDGRHKEHPLGQNWFERDPGGKKGNSQYWFSPDLIEKILEANTNHEIACHSFSHVEFGKKEVTKEIARAELNKCVDLAEQWGVNLRSLTFPRNNIGHLDILSEFNFTTYRGRTPTQWYDPFPLRRAGKSLSYIFGANATSPIVQPEVNEFGVKNVPSSLFLFNDYSVSDFSSRKLLKDPLLRAAKKGINKAKSENGIFHIWFHPNDVRSNNDLHRVEIVLKTLSKLSQSGEIEVKTMAEI